MRENLAGRMPPAQVSEESLGAVVVSCRNRSTGERGKALGQSLLPAYPAAFMFGLIASGGTALILKELHIRIEPSEFRLLSNAIIALVCVAIIAPLYRRPRRPLLVLYERGLRYRKTNVHFDELASIEFGRDMSRIEAAMSSFDRLTKNLFQQFRLASEMAEQRKRLSLTLIYKNGVTKLLDEALLRPLPEDLGRFLLKLGEMRPGLLGVEKESLFAQD